MNTPRTNFLQQAFRGLAYIGCFLGSVVVGGLLCQQFEIHFGPSLPQPSPRSFPEGWIALGFGILIFALSVPFLKRGHRISGFLCAGFGVGFCLVSGIGILLSKALPLGC